MPKQGGQGKGKPKLVDRNFGKALIRQRLRDDAAGGSKKGEPIQMSSILDNSALDDYVLSQEMANATPEVYRPKFDEAIIVQPIVANVVQSLSSQDYDYQHLRIPRKPAWNTSMTAEEVDRREKAEFLNWRRYIAALEDKSTQKVTPFEKNLEVWRQLWRVLERSDMAVQIVDARNPLLYYTNDLEKYASEHSPPRPMMLLVNKADFLTDFQRIAWARRFAELGLRYVFYSAKIEQEKIDKAAVEVLEQIDIDPLSNLDISEAPTDSGDEEDDLVGEETSAADVGEAAVPVTTDASLDVEWIAKQLSQNCSMLSDGEVEESGKETFPFNIAESDESFRRSAIILTREQLIQLLTQLPMEFGLSPQSRHGRRICIGMLGYPNVGKSSVINSLLGVAKSTHDKVRVAVSSTPGKTKHFQTLMLTDELMLCDCPGLVFPSFMNSTGEMLCAGILPINQMKDYVAPAAVIASRIPQQLLEAAYGMHIHRQLDFKDNPDRPPNAHEFLIGYCMVKGYITNGTGRWDEFRACKEVLRDFNDGRLLFVAPPFIERSDDEVSVRAARHWRTETEKIMMRRERVAERLAALKLAEFSATTQEPVISSNVDAMSGTMVFGDKLNWSDSSAQDSKIEQGAVHFDDESSSDGDEDVSLPTASTMESASRREHKRLKHWGKKNKKLRDKDPYGESNGVVSYAVFSTNRSRSGVVKSEEEMRRRRQDPRATYGMEFTRAIHPHHVATSILSGPLSRDDGLEKQVKHGGKGPVDQENS